MTSTLLYPPVMSSMNKMSSHEDYSSADSESRKHHQPGSASKKRPSRAGTRSVTTLSAAQLERKRANDREAQRAIRQRTKDHIESLERRIADLQAQDNNARMLEYVQRNEALQRENALLQDQLQRAQATLVSLGHIDNSGMQGSEGAILPGQAAPSTSDRLQSIHQPRASSTSTARSIPPIASSAVSQSEWVQHPTYSPAATSSPMEAPSQAVHHHEAANTSDLRWTSHSHAHAASTQTLAAVTPTSYHNVEQPQLSYYSAEHASRNVQYNQDTAQSQQSLPFGNPPPHQQSVAQQQAPTNPYSYTHTTPNAPHQIGDFGRQQQQIASQHQQYQTYPQHQSYMSPSPSQASSQSVQQAGEGLQMMHQQGSAAPQPAGHMMYEMKPQS